LGPACNHVAALLFYIEYYSHGYELPTEISRTSLPMKWNQPPKKTVKAESANYMNFVKPTHGDDPEMPSSKEIKRSTFDPRQSEHQKLDKRSVDNFFVRFWNLSQTLVCMLLPIGQSTLTPCGVLSFSLMCMPQQWPGINLIL